MIDLRVHSSPFDLDNSTPSSVELAGSYLRWAVADSKHPRFKVPLVRGLRYRCLASLSLREASIGFCLVQI
ncbi:hypothetical protein TNCV_399211 [Trichonephila clavipes]|nr:hypothetical protein TNCV_399211 [Trichonephila clavipes]